MIKRFSYFRHIGVQLLPVSCSAASEVSLLHFEWLRVLCQWRSTAFDQVHALNIFSKISQVCVVLLMIKNVADVFIIMTCFKPTHLDLGSLFWVSTNYSNASTTNDVITGRHLLNRRMLPCSCNPTPIVSSQLLSRLCPSLNNNGRLSLSSAFTLSRSKLRAPARRRDCIDVCVTSSAEVKWASSAAESPRCTSAVELVSQCFVSSSNQARRCRYFPLKYHTIQFLARFN